MHLLMGGIHIFEKPCYREIHAMRGRVIRGLPVLAFYNYKKMSRKLSISSISAQIVSFLRLLTYPKPSFMQLAYSKQP